MTLVRWNPFNDLLNLQDEMARQAVGGTWSPAVDIFERGDDLVIRAELPGVKSEDVDVRVEDGAVMISGERKREEEIRRENSYRLERAYGKFSRSFRLPEKIDATKVSADYRDGILEVRLPKAEEAKPRKIAINAA